MIDFQINVESSDTLHSLFQKRVKKSPDAPAYCQFNPSSDMWKTYTWHECSEQVARYRQAMLREGLTAGDRVAMMLHNCIEWVVFDQAALSLGLVTVPLFSEDNANSCAYILRDAGVRLLLVGNQRQLEKIQSQREFATDLSRVVCCETLTTCGNSSVVCLADWLAASDVRASEADCFTGEETSAISADTLATLVYTSGTTGQPKGVILTHKNIVSNVRFVSRIFDFHSDDLFLSFLPLSHIFERVAGYYMTMLFGSRVVFVRSIAKLQEDLCRHRPTVLLSVPRIYERIHTKLRQKFSLPPLRLLLRLCVAIGYRRYRRMQIGKPIYWLKPAWWVCDKIVAEKIRAILGGRIRCAVVGGAPMPAEIAHIFLACGVPIYQGYGLTEASPVVAVNRPQNNLPESIGPPIPEIEVRIDERHELLTRSDCVMQGYWGLPEASKQAIDKHGWLHTGDMASMDQEKRLFITGRIKEIIVMSNGEKVPPVDIEMAITSAGLVSQAMVYGEGRPFLIALVVPVEEMIGYEDTVTLSAALRKAIAKELKNFPVYARIRRVLIVQAPWTVENGMLTPTLKLKRASIIAAHQNEIEAVYRAF